MLKRTLAVLTSLSLGGALGCPSDPKPANPMPANPPANPPASKPAGDHGAHAATKPGVAPTAPGEAAVHFVTPQDGSTIFEDAHVIFGLKGMTIRPAGQDPEDRTSGHHHLIIDGEGGAAGAVVPADETHIHFGKGQTETKVKLTEGAHTLTMQFADGAHRSYGPKLSTTIKVNVVKSAGERKVFFESPADGAKVKSPVKMKFGIAGMKVRPAGEAPLDKTTGHHHVIVDGEPGAAGTVVPADETHIHYGKGQTEAELKLAPGKHTLTLQLADGAHVSYGKDLSATITVEVE